jgi:hypothetical protein
VIARCWHNGPGQRTVAARCTTKKEPWAHYGTDHLELDDRTLAHVQVVVVAKLRKGEAFLLSWNVDPEKGSGRYALWMETGVPIVFRYEGSRPIRINRAWLDAMMERSYTLAGLDLMPEGEYPDTPQAQVP